MATICSDFAVAEILEQADSTRSSYMLESLYTSLAKQNNVSGYGVLSLAYDPGG